MRSTIRTIGLLSGGPDLNTRVSIQFNLEDANYRCRLLVPEEGKRALQQRGPAFYYPTAQEAFTKGLELLLSAVTG